MEKDFSREKNEGKAKVDDFFILHTSKVVITVQCPWPQGNERQSLYKLFGFTLMP